MLCPATSVYVVDRRDKPDAIASVTLVLIKRFVCVGQQLLWVKVLVRYATGHAKAGGDANRAAFKRHMKLLDVRAQSLGQPRRRGRILDCTSPLCGLPHPC
jgi:hypothetical protein